MYLLPGTVEVTGVERPGSSAYVIVDMSEVTHRSVNNVDGSDIVVGSGARVQFNREEHSTQIRVTYRNGKKLIMMDIPSTRTFVLSRDDAEVFAENRDDIYQAFERLEPYE